MIEFILRITNRNRWILPSIQRVCSNICCACSNISLQLSTEKLENSHSIICANQTSAPRSKSFICIKHSCVSKMSKPTSQNLLLTISRYCSGNGRSVFHKRSSTNSRSFSAPTCSVINIPLFFKTRCISFTLKSPWRFITRIFYRPIIFYYNSKTNQQ